MKSLYIFLTIIAATQAISGGENTDINLHKSLLSLRYKGKHFCGASLIDKDWALTSASCLDNYSTDLSVQGGSTDISSNNGVNVDVESFIVYPTYKKETREDDLALLHFATSFEINDLISPAMLPFRDISDITAGVEIALTGWGSTESDGAYSEVLQVGYSSAINRPDCLTRFPYVTLNEFCAGDYNVQNVSACEGDFGGQATVDNCLKGIILWSGSCGESPTVMTQISTYKRWILSTSEITDYIACPN